MIRPSDLRFISLMRMLVLLPLLLPTPACGRVGGDHHYSLKHRSNVQTMELTFDELHALRPLSFSEDSDPVLLETFSVTVFETGGMLPQSPSLNSIQAAFEEFLFKELNSLFNVNHQVKSVHSRVLDQTPAASSTGGVAVMMGTRLQVAIDIIFDYSPTPDTAEVENAVKRIMRQSDLSSLASNITNRSKDDMFLEDVHTVVYDGMLPDFVEISNGDSDGAPGIVTTATSPEGTSFFSSSFLVPIFIAFALLLLGVLLFIAPRRTKEDSHHDSPPTSNRHSANPVSIFGSEDGNIDLYIEGSLSPEEMEGYSSIEPETQSPRSHLSQKSTLSSAWNKKSAGDDQSDVFSGLVGISSTFGRTSDLSPRGNGDNRSIYSFLTGLTSRGSKASTVMASNVTAPALSPKTSTSYQPVMSPNSVTPHSRMSSLFTFSEEEEADETDIETLTKDGNREIRPAPSDEGKTYSIEEEENSIEESEGVEQKSPVAEHLSPNSALSFSALAAGAMALMQGSTRGDTNRDPDDDQNAPSTGPTVPSLPMNPGKSSLLTTEEITKELGEAEKERRLGTIKNEAISDDSFTNQAQCNILGARPMIDQRAERNVVQAQRDASPILFVASSGRSTPDMGSQDTGPEPPPMRSFSHVTGPTHNNHSIQRIASADKAYSHPDSPAQSTATHHTDPGHRTGRSPAKTNFIKRFFSSPRRSSAKSSSGFLGGVTPTAALASRDQFADDAEEEDPQTRRATRSAGIADGTSAYQTDNADHGSTVSSYKGSLSFRRGQGKPLSVGDKMEFEAKLPEKNEEEWISPSGRIRRHAKSTEADGTNNYQNEFMHDYSVADLDDEEPSILNDSNRENSKRRLKVEKEINRAEGDHSPRSPHNQSVSTPKSPSSTVSGLSGASPRAKSGSPNLASKNLISDLLWLERKITATDDQRGQSQSPAGRHLQHGDSLSFESADGPISTQSDSSIDKSDERDSYIPATSGIICRDCVAPPGKLKIVICSTKDGPAIHTVKKGSSLEGQVHSGDLIISVDDVDTRSYSAEQVMKLMTSKTNQSRRITVLHFDENDVVP